MLILPKDTCHCDNRGSDTAGAQPCMHALAKAGVCITVNLFHSLEAQQYLTDRPAVAPVLNVIALTDWPLTACMMRVPDVF